MKKSHVFVLCCALGLCHANLFSAATAGPNLSPADQAWLEVRTPLYASMPNPTGAQRPTNAEEVRAAMAPRAAAAVAHADRAKNFQVLYPANKNAPDAKLVEVRALVSAVELGDATVEGRLSTAVQALREETTLPSQIRVQAIAAYEFSRRMRGLKTHESRLEAIEEVARSLIVEFPGEPQGYESLLTLANGSADEAKAKKIAHELERMPVPPAIKEETQRLVGRIQLVGQPLAAELTGANETEVKTKLQEGVPTIIYSWATWNPGSLALAARLKVAGGAANFIGVNLDQDRTVAEAAAQREALVGNLVYDSRGREGALAKRLKLGNAGEVLLVDAQGIIREVRGQGELTAKLKQIGL